jgi:AcrR family transcriptional regulator
MSEPSDGDGTASPWSPREAELLEVTLRLLHEFGYERLTVEAVANTARASKATVYRRWPSKAELVLAAFIEGVRQVAVPPDTGTLRGDLLWLGEIIRYQTQRHAGAMRAVIAEAAHNPALNDAIEHQFMGQRRAVIQQVLRQAVDRGEIDEAAVTDDLWDLLPGYLIYRSIVPARPPSSETVRALVENFLVPGLTRSTG